MIQFGLRLHDAEKLPVEQVLPLVRQKGFTCAHVALSKSFKELPCTPSALTPGYALYLRHLFEKNGIDIAVLGNYLNLAHPDADALHAIQEKYYAHIRFASLLGCGMVGTETGAPDAEYKFCPECRSDAALSTFIKNFKPVVRCAEQYGVTIAIEPVVKHIVYDARRARTVLDEIGSPNLQILFDPVNLLNMENVDRREEVFAEAIELLGKDIAMQVAAANPGYVDEASVPAEVVAKEKEIMLAQMAGDPKTANKPEAVKQKMIEGKIKKFFKENCLVDQEFVKDSDLTVAQYTAKVAKDLGGDIKIVKFTRFQKGEGLEKRADDFAAEVASMVK